MTNWKDVAVGSASTLLVTIVGGVAIWYLTREPPQKTAAEQLIYEVQQAAAFQSSSTKLGLHTVRVTNAGDATASSVKVVLDYSPSVSVVDRVASLSSGSAGSFALSTPTPQRVEVTVATLLPGENLTLSVLLDEPRAARPTVAVRSDKTLGLSAASASAAAPPPTRTISNTLGSLIPVIAVLQIPLALYFSRRFRRAARTLVGYERSLNNTAFVLLHQGLVDDASKLLRKAIAAGEADANVLSNHALCQALAGDTDGAQRSLSAAELYEPRSGVIHFNRAFIALVAKDSPTAVRELEEAVRLRGPEVKRWCALSRLFAQYATDTPEVRALVEKAAVSAG